MLSIKKLPSPAGIPLLGNILQIKPSRIYQVLCDWARELGGFYTFKIGSKCILVVTEPDVMAELLHERPGKFRRWVKMEELGLEVGADGVFVAEGDKWRRHRRLITPTFNLLHIKNAWEAIDATTRRLQQRWLNFAVDGSSVDMRQEAMSYTVDVVTGFAFGYEINTLEESAGELQGALSSFLQTAARRQAAVFPYWRYITLKSDREFNVALTRINHLVSGFIKSARERMENGSSPPLPPVNMIEKLVAHQNSAGSESLSDGEIIGNVLTFLLAGEDTTANTIAWAVYFIARHPVVQEKLQMEVDRVLNSTAVIPTIDQLDKLPYAHAIIQETMRLKPVFPLLTLEPNENVEIQGVEVFKGTPVFLLIGYPGQDTRHFIRAGEFLPERWLDSQAYEQDNKKACTPFGIGPRHCPGHQLAMHEALMAISMLAKNFDVKADESAGPTEEIYAFTLCPSHVSVCLMKRHE